MRSWIFLLFFCLTFTYSRGQEAVQRVDQLLSILDYQRAIKVCEQQLERAYDDALALRLGYAYWQLGKAEEGLYWYRQAIRSEVAQAIDYLRFAQLLARQNRCQEAEDWFEQYAESAPFDQRASQLANLCAYQEHLRAKNFGHYELQAARLNTEFVENTAYYTGAGIYFASERPVPGPVEQVQAQSNQPFSNLYFAPWQGGGPVSWPFDPQLGPPSLLDRTLNTDLHETSPVYHQATRSLFYTRSARQNGKLLRDLDGLVPLEIVFSQKVLGESWREPEGLPFSSAAYNFMHPAVDPSGEWLVFASDLPGGYGGMDLYISQRTRWGWGAPTNLGPQINTEGQELFPAWWPDGHLTFASDGHPGLGGLDIWQASRTGDRQWRAPENPGAPINSAHDDFSWQPFLDPVFSVLSSNRAGQDDIYWVRRISPAIDFKVIDTRTGEPVQGLEVQRTSTGEAGRRTQFLQALNACDTYLFSADGYRPQQFEWCTYISEPGSAQEQVVFLEPNPEIELVGVAFDQGTGLPLAGVDLQLEAFCAESETRFTTDLTGRFIFSLESGCCYRLKGTKEGYLAALNEQLCISAETGDSLYRKKIYLQPILYTGRNSPWNSIAVESGTYQDERTGFWMDALTGLPANGIYPDGRTYQAGKLVDRGALAQTLLFAKGRTRPRINEPIPFLLNIYYDFNQSSIRTDATPELERLLRMLQENPRYRVEIGAHTDARGGDRYNLRLSQKRAEAVVNWLIRRGVPASRLVARGYGETRLVNRCSDGQACEEWQHQMNRRTEFRVIAVE